MIRRKLPGLPPALVEPRNPRSPFASLDPNDITDLGVGVIGRPVVDPGTRDLMRLIEAEAARRTQRFLQAQDRHHDFDVPLPLELSDVIEAVENFLELFKTLGLVGRPQLLTGVQVQEYQARKIPKDVKRDRRVLSVLQNLFVLGALALVAEVACFSFAVL